MASLVNNSTFEYNSLKEYGSIICGTRGAETEKYWYHQDIRGSTTAIVGANGKLQKGYSYDTFGAIEESGSKSFLNEVTFTGSVTDNSTGLQYMNSRFYDSSTGRFITQDSYSGNPYDPWTQHLYSYCGNNPVNMVDPTGHFCISAIIIGAIVGAVIGAGIVGYQDYKDDGKIFNGSKTVGDYALGVAIGGAAGAAVGAAVGAVSAAGGVGAAVKAAGAGIKSAATWVGTKAVAAGTAVATQGKKIIEDAKEVGTKSIEVVKNVFSSNVSPAKQAANWQGQGAYPGVDSWENMVLEKGTTVWGGAPGQSGFYTSSEVMSKVGNDAQLLNQGLQIGKNGYDFYRAGTTAYEVLKNTRIAVSNAVANPQFGPGGFQQYYIPNYEDVLRPMYSIRMMNR